MATKSFHRIISEAGEFRTKKERAEYLIREKNPLVAFFVELAYTDRWQKLIAEDEIPEYRKGPSHDYGGYLYGNWRMMHIFVQGQGYDDLPQAKRIKTFAMFLQSMDGADADLMELIFRNKRFPKLDITVMREAFPELNIPE